MALALQLARRGLGRTAPNPPVGCVLVKNGRVVGRGWTQPGGRPHAEAEALRRAGDSANGATAYISLEPCHHHGATPPCTEALIAAGVGRCVVALTDPDQKVAGNGLDRLRAAGINVETGVAAGAAAELYRGYTLQRRDGRPSVTLKLATTLDGRIATRRGESQWITGPDARTHGHRLRATHDAVMVGSGTAVADNPRLSVRLPGLADQQPLRVVVDGRLRVPLTHDLVARASEHPTVLITRTDALADRRAAYESAGVTVVQVAVGRDGTLSPFAALQALGTRGITRVLVEGGSVLAAGLSRADLIDDVIWFRAPRVIGGDGVPAIAGFGLERLNSTPMFERTGAERVGPDIMETYRRAT
jgi:diaminohydroxyphosphoribosylaminopyrimidine deaminase/5-amino-6-(5-phosphoribosylamino)uracil reductase